MGPVALSVIRLILARFEKNPSRERRLRFVELSVTKLGGAALLGSIAHRYGRKNSPA
jgi:hypothetical protein